MLTEQFLSPRGSTEGQGEGGEAGLAAGEHTLAFLLSRRGTIAGLGL